MARRNKANERTRDYLFWNAALCRYAERTGDYRVLDYDKLIDKRKKVPAWAKDPSSVRAGLELRQSPLPRQVWHWNGCGFSVVVDGFDVKVVVPPVSIPNAVVDDVLAHGDADAAVLRLVKSIEMAEFVAKNLSQAYKEYIGGQIQS